MAEDIINAMPSAQGLNLGRANLSTQRPWMSNRRAGAAQQNTVVGAVAQLGMQIAGDAIDERRRQNFYEGQNRILNATLDGTQKEELQRIVSDEPWYAEVLGHGAMAKGAMEQAARSGAGKIFADWNSRLATGEDVQESPDVYKQKVMDFIKAQRTGDVDVDNAFLPSMIQTGQLLVQTQLQKHLEFNVQKTIQGVTTETYDVLKGTELAAKDERGPAATFNEDMAPGVRGPAEQAAYLQAVATFDPNNKPANLDINKWKELKLQTALPLIERGGTSIAQAMEESGFTKGMTPKEREHFDDARRKGKITNDAQREREFIGDEISLIMDVHNISSRDQIPALMDRARMIRNKYLSVGYTTDTLPEDFRTEDKMRNWMEMALSRVKTLEDQEEARRHTAAVAERRRQERINEINYTEQLKLGPARATYMGILENLKVNNPRAPVAVQVGNSVVPVSPTAAQAQDAYFALKQAYNMTENPKERQRLLQQYNVASLEDAGRKLQVVDPETRGQANLLAGERGSLSPSAAATASLVKLVNMARTGDWDYVKSHVPDAATMVAFRQYDKMVANGSTTADAWKASFARPLGTGAAVKYTASQLDTGTRRAVRDLNVNPAQAGWARTEVETQAKYYLDSGLAMDLSHATSLATEDISRRLDVVNGQAVLGVPPGEKLTQRMSLLDPATADAALELYVREDLGIKGKYGIRYEPALQPKNSPTDPDVRWGHIVYPLDSAGRPDTFLQFPINYEDARNKINSAGFSRYRPVEANGPTPIDSDRRAVQQLFN